MGSSADGSRTRRGRRACPRGWCAARAGTGAGCPCRPSRHYAVRAAYCPGVETLRYGTHPDQVVDLTFPAAAARPPLVVLLHGGFWRVAYDRVHLRVVADALTAEGFAVANVEYRRVGGGGGWPSTFTDVGDAVDAVQVALADRVDLGSVAYVGHSAGGHLALWAAAAGPAPGRRARSRGTRAPRPRGGGPGTGRRPGRGRPARPERRGGPRAARRQPDHRPRPLRRHRPRRARRPGRRHRRRARPARRHRARRGVAGLPRPHRGRRWSRSPAPGTSS